MSSPSVHDTSSCFNTCSELPSEAQLVTFDGERHNPASASAPVPTSTQETLVEFMCEGYGKCCKSKTGLVAHRQVQVRGSVSKNMAAQSACADCHRLFPMKTDLSQNHRYAHPTQHNADKLDRVKTSSARWSQQESQSFAGLTDKLYPSCETQPPSWQDWRNIFLVDRLSVAKPGGKKSVTTDSSCRNCSVSGAYPVEAISTNRYNKELSNTEDGTSVRARLSPRVIPPNGLKSTSDIVHWIRLPKDSSFSCIHAGRREVLVIQSLSSALSIWTSRRKKYCPRIRIKCSKSVFRSESKVARKLGTLRHLRIPSSRTGEHLFRHRSRLTYRRVTVNGTGIILDGRGVTVWSEKKQKYVRLFHRQHKAMYALNLASLDSYCGYRIELNGPSKVHRHDDNEDRLGGECRTLSTLQQQKGDFRKMTVAGHLQCGTVNTSFQRRTSTHTQNGMRKTSTIAKTNAIGHAISHTYRESSKRKLFLKIHIDSVTGGVNPKIIAIVPSHPYSLKSNIRSTCSEVPHYDAAPVFLLKAVARPRIPIIYPP
ncbi:hypothetical protein CLF_110645, partial [Clonorchis sinensis]